MKQDGVNENSRDHEEENVLPDHILYDIFKKCSFDRCIHLSSYCSKFTGFSKRVDFNICKILELFETVGLKPNDEFIQEAKLNWNTDKHWRQIFEQFAPYIRWNQTPIFTDRSNDVPSSIKRVILAQNDLMQVEVHGGLISYVNGKEVCTTVTGKIPRSSIVYTSHHVIARLPETPTCYTLLDYSLDQERIPSAVSCMTSLNAKIGDAERNELMQASSNTQHAVLQYNERIIVYDWVKDRILYDLPRHERMNMLISEYFTDGTVGRTILKHEFGNSYIILDFVKNNQIKIETGRYCKIAVPIFSKDLIWTVDSQMQQDVFSMLDGARLSNDKLDLDIDICQAVYVDCINRLVLLCLDGSTQVGEVSSNGTFVRCGTLEYGSCREFVVESMVSGPCGLALVGDKCLRYLSFRQPLVR